GETAVVEGKLSALAAAAKVLAETGTALTCKELVGAMAAKGYWTSPGGKTPEATLHAAISTEIRKRGDAARFRKAAPGRFAAAGTVGTLPPGAAGRRKPRRERAGGGGRTPSPRRPRSTDHTTPLRAARAQRILGGRPTPPRTTSWTSHPPRPRVTSRRPHRPPRRPARPAPGSRPPSAWSWASSPSSS
ncbi:winged helix-turn-helix domain-containing protein, partial [bacterium]|nr:winged helix-turn-helix domain-containing protein [bacterium]